MPHPVRPRLRRGDEPIVVAPANPLVNFTVSFYYAELHLTITHKSMARDWVGALDLALADRRREVSTDTPTIIKVERK